MSGYLFTVTPQSDSTKTIWFATKI